MKRRRTASMTLALLAAVVATGLPARSESPSQALSAEEEVRQAELAFAAAARARDRHAFADLIADDAIFVDVVGHNGKPAILEAWAPFFEEGGPEIDWTPKIVEIQKGGRAGLSHGSYSVAHTDESGRRVVSSGLFTSIWRREADGSWRVIFDFGCPPAPAS